MRDALALAALLVVAPSAFAAEHRVVPFSRPDLAGRTWTPADLAGRTALVNVWATWCVPCRDELPFVEELAKRLADRKDVVVVTISIDEKPEDARAFVAKQGFTFPVLLGPEFVETHFLSTGLGIPVTWLVDPDGVIRREPPRFEDEAKGAAWVEAMLRTLTEPTPAR